ncbi:MAG: hypothetical protein ACRDX9_15055 [Acidimicrobiia bacterium]
MCTTDPPASAATKDVLAALHSSGKKGPGFESEHRAMDSMEVGTFQIVPDLSGELAVKRFDGMVMLAPGSHGS